MLTRRRMSAFPVVSVGYAASVVYLFTERLELFSVDVVPYQLHIIPICDDAMLQGVLDLQQSSQLLCSFSNECVAFQRSC